MFFVKIHRNAKNVTKKSPKYTKIPIATLKR